MPDNFSSAVPVCRPALPSDKGDVLEFTKFIWDGHDYIQYVWDEWLSDPWGMLAVVEYAGHAVALGKATYVAEGQWWLEGLRVDPKYQGLKLGSYIFRYLDDWWKQHGGGTYRLMTSWERVQVHHLCERFGWQKIGEVKAYEVTARSGERHAFRPVAQGGTAEALRFAAAKLDHSWGLADLGWKFARPTETTMEHAQGAGMLYWWGDGTLRPGKNARGHGGGVSSTAPRNDPAARGLLSYWEDEDDGQRLMAVSIVACELSSIQGALMDVRRLAGELGFSSVLWHAPANEDVEAALIEAGYESKWPGSAYLFGKTST